MPRSPRSTQDTSRYASVRQTNPEEQWLSEEQVLRYNGSLRTEYDSNSEASDSSEDDTLSLTSSVSEGTIVRVLFEDSD